MYEKYGDGVEFFMVYVREAHPTDGWQVGSNEREEVLFAQPTSLDERVDVAHAMCEQLEIAIPTLVDNMKNTTEKDYSAHPDRLYLVGMDGTIAYKSGRGPWGFKPPELENAIRKTLGLEVEESTPDEAPARRRRRAAR